MVKETRLVLKNVGKINPELVEDYIHSGGFVALKKALERGPVEVIDEVIKSGLRGRGGAGFSTGLKLKFTHDSSSATNQKYLICNADEGEPGTFKDRIIMENDPFILIEGIIIAAYAVGASKAFIYIRGEYSLSIERVKKAVIGCWNKGFLGSNILGSTFSLDIEVKPGAGSYLCGEELTLIESLEGKRGYPRIKPPFPAQKGLFNLPTLVNNVETLATLPLILGLGADNFLKYGTQETPGTKIFTISGDVINPGYFEVELGVTLRQLVFELGGGIKNGKKLKAILIGGAAGTFVNESLLDIPTGYDSLRNNSAILGSGAIIVLDENRSVLDMTRSILEFFRHESCGKCVPCRVGTTQLVNLIHEAKSNQIDKHLVSRLIYEADYMAKNSLCPLGQSPIIPIRSLQIFFSGKP